MDRLLQQAVHRAQEMEGGADDAVKVVSVEPAGGGSIARSRIVSLADGRRWFVKTMPGDQPYPGLFEAEYEALERLARPGVIHVPRPLAVGPDFLVMEAFRTASPAADWQELMGRQLARLHLATRTDDFGFDVDNYIGTTPQPNARSQDWVSFWREQRLGWQLEVYRRQAPADDPVLQSGERLKDCLEDRLAAVDEPAVLLHGDLWAGNAAAGEKGEPVIFDPASYHGRREAEFGMMRLFGGFDAVCEAAYQEVWPLPDGFEERLPVYRLYHELNHLNLFGAMYHSQCLTTLRGLV